MVGVPRFHRLEFATFDGKEDPIQWLNRCDQFFDGQRTIEEEKVWLASYHMTGVARTWYGQLQRDAPPLSWSHFKQLCQQRFGPPLRSNPLGELARLPFRTTVDDYQERFWDLLAQTAPLSQEQQVQLFTAGLPDRIKIDVELMAPRDLNQALSLARAYERRSQALDIHPAATPSKALRQPHRPSVPVPALQPQIPTAVSTAPQRPFKKLTPAEMAKRRRQGLCYNCDEQYVRGHRCPRLFYLEVTDFEGEAMETDLEEPEPVISLHALTGIQSEGTMQLEVSIRGHALTALLDTGSTHNFINLGTASTLKLEYNPSQGLHATVANGDKVSCCRFPNSISMTIGLEDFLMDAYAIPLDSFDIILGVQFLRTLGPTLWDLEDLCLAFWRRGKRILWKGMGSSRVDIHMHPAVRTVNAASEDSKPMMDRLLQQFQEVFTTPSGLPPARRCDHRIHLLPGTVLVAAHPFEAVGTYMAELLLVLFLAEDGSCDHTF